MSSKIKTEPQKSERAKNFLEAIDAKGKVEEKISAALDAMKEILATDKTPIFRDFWQVKNRCLELFKEQLSPRVRSVLWSRYTELSDQIRQVKEVFDEQSAFTEEQIDLAIAAIDVEIDGEKGITKDIAPVEVPENVAVLQKNASLYQEMQSELEHLNVYAGRLNALRKELIPIQMRQRVKHQFFTRLSQLGDRVFPKRKELIAAISALLKSDIEEYIAVPLSFEKRPIPKQKDEVKTLQNFAKILTISSRVFHDCRQMLSERWQQIKDAETEKRKERADQGKRWDVNAEEMAKKISLLKEQCDCDSITLDESRKMTEVLKLEMKQLDLGREGEKRLRAQLSKATRSLEEKQQKIAEEQKKAAEKRRKNEELQRHSLMESLKEVHDQADAYSLDALVEKSASLIKERDSLSVEGVEQELIDSRMTGVSDLIQEKKWEMLQQAEVDDHSAEMHALLDERITRKGKLKEDLERHRKSLGVSNLDFESSLYYQELVSEEKGRLQAVESLIEEIEEKVFETE